MNKMTLLKSVSGLSAALILFLSGCSKSPGPESDETKQIKELVNNAVALADGKGKEVFAQFRKKESQWFSGETYIFVFDMKGTNMVHPSQPELEGENLIDLKDVNGKAFIHEIIEVAKTKGSGWVDYMWPKPGETEPSKKLSYIKTVKVGDEDFIIASGVYSE